MKKLLLLPLIFISCGKLKQHDVIFNNPTDTDLEVNSESMGLDDPNTSKGLIVYSYTNEIIMDRKGTYIITVHSKTNKTNYTEVVEVGNESITVTLHK